MKFSKREREKERWSGRSPRHFTRIRVTSEVSVFGLRYSLARRFVDNVEIFVNYDPSFNASYTTVYCDNMGGREGGGVKIFPTRFGDGMVSGIDNTYPPVFCLFFFFFFWVSVFRACRIERKKKKRKSKYTISFLNNEGNLVLIFFSFQI